MSLPHVYGADVTGARLTARPLSRTVSGYGAKLPLPYMLTLTDGRERRVYAVCYGNAASAYVIVGGERHYFSPIVEAILEAVREGRDWQAARDATLNAFATAGISER